MGDERILRSSPRPPDGRHPSGAERRGEGIIFILRTGRAPEVDRAARLSFSWTTLIYKAAVACGLLAGSARACAQAERQR